MAKKLGKADINDLVSALERQATDILAFAGQAERKTRTELHDLKEKFRERVDVFEALLLTIESKLDDLSRDKRDWLRRQIDELTLFVLSKSVHSNIEFCRLVQAGDEMPLWAREIFARDVAVLERARERLSDPQYADRVRQDDLANIDTMIGILTELIAKAPQLPVFKPQRWADEYYPEYVFK